MCSVTAFENVVADPKAFLHGGGERPAFVHRGDQARLPRVDAGLADRVDGDVGHRLAALEGERHLVREGDRPHAGQRRGEARHEARAIVARALDVLPQLDGVLGLEMAARRVVRAGERHEGDLALLPQRQDGFAQRRMESPVAVERDRRGRRRRIGPGDGQRRTRGVVEVTAGRDHDIGRIIGAAQKHDEQARIGLRGRPDAAGDRHRSKCDGRERGEAGEEIATVQLSVIGQRRLRIFGQSGTVRQRRTRNPTTRSEPAAGFRVRCFAAPRNDAELITPTHLTA